MRRIEVFTKEDIERFGFVYEPDRSKCKSAKTKMYYTTFTVDKNGKVEVLPCLYEHDSMGWGYTPTIEEFKKQTSEYIWMKHLHSVFAEVPEQSDIDQWRISGTHGHPKVMICGHTYITSSGELSAISRSMEEGK